MQASDYKLQQYGHDTVQHTAQQNKAMEKTNEKDTLTKEWKERI